MRRKHHPDEQNKIKKYKNADYEAAINEIGDLKEWDAELRKRLIVFINTIKSFEIGISLFVNINRELLSSLGLYSEEFKIKNVPVTFTKEEDDPFILLTLPYFYIRVLFDEAQQINIEFLTKNTSALCNRNTGTFSDFLLQQGQLVSKTASLMLENASPEKAQELYGYFTSQTIDLPQIEDLTNGLVNEEGIIFHVTTNKFNDRIALAACKSKYNGLFYALLFENEKSSNWQYLDVHRPLLINRSNWRNEYDIGRKAYNIALEAPGIPGFLVVHDGCESSFVNLQSPKVKINLQGTIVDSPVPDIVEDGLPKKEDKEVSVPTFYDITFGNKDNNLTMAPKIIDYWEQESILHNEGPTFTNEFRESHVVDFDTFSLYPDGYKTSDFRLTNSLFRWGKQDFNTTMPFGHRHLDLEYVSQRFRNSLDDYHDKKKYTIQFNNLIIPVEPLCNGKGRVTRVKVCGKNITLSDLEHLMDDLVCMRNGTQETAEAYIKEISKLGYPYRNAIMYGVSTSGGLLQFRHEKSRTFLKFGDKYLPFYNLRKFISYGKLHINNIILQHCPALHLSNLVELNVKAQEDQELIIKRSEDLLNEAIKVVNGSRDDDYVYVKGKDVSYRIDLKEGIVYWRNGKNNWERICIVDKLSRNLQAGFDPIVTRVYALANDVSLVDKIKTLEKVVNEDIEEEVMEVAI